MTTTNTLDANTTSKYLQRTTDTMLSYQNVKNNWMTSFLFTSQEKWRAQVSWRCTKTRWCIRGEIFTGEEDTEKEASGSCRLLDEGKQTEGSDCVCSSWHLISTRMGKFKCSDFRASTGLANRPSYIEYICFGFLGRSIIWASNAMKQYKTERGTPWCSPRESCAGWRRSDGEFASSFFSKERCLPLQTWSMSNSKSGRNMHKLMTNSTQALKNSSTGCLKGATN